MSVNRVKKAMRRETLEAISVSAGEAPQATISELSEAQVERNPHSADPVLGTAELSCRDLNTRANPLDRILIGLFPKIPPAVGASHFTIASLDGIRAVSILLVVVGHCGLGKIIPGGLGVTTFFFLSGYLITTLLRREIEATETINLGNFYIRRALRILPPCLIVFLVSTGIALVLRETLTMRGVLAGLFYWTNYYNAFDGEGIVPGLVVLWSLAVEEHFYFLFPLLYLGIAFYSKRTQSNFLLLACLAVLAWRCVLVYALHSPTSRTYLCTDTRLDSILWGCLFAIVSNPALGDRPASRLATYPAMIFGVALMLASLLVRGEWFRETFRYTVQGVALMPLFAFAVKQPSSLPFKVLNSYIMRLLGIYSYTIYLTHFVILYYAEHLFHVRPLPAFPVVLVLSFIIAAAMYQFVDLPAAALRKRFSVPTRNDRRMAASVRARHARGTENGPQSSN